MLFGRELNRERDSAEEADNERVHREGAGAAWHDYAQSVYVNNHTPLRIIFALITDRSIRGQSITC